MAFAAIFDTLEQFHDSLSQNMPSISSEAVMQLLSLEQASFTDSWSAILVLRNIGSDTVEITKYAMYGMWQYSRDSHLNIQPGEVENLKVSIRGLGYRFERDKNYEVWLRTRTHPLYHIIFTITPIVELHKSMKARELLQIVHTQEQ